MCKHFERRLRVVNVRFLMAQASIAGGFRKRELKHF